MAATAITFITNALISSETQINTLDSHFNDNSKFKLGSQIKLIMVHIQQNYVESKNSLNALKSVSEICLESNFGSIGRVLGLVLNKMHQYLNNEHSSHYEDLNEVADSKPESNDDLIVIDSDDEEPCNLKTINRREYGFDVIWIDALKHAIDQIEPDISTDCNEYRTINDFKQCLLMSLHIDAKRFNEVSSLEQLTDILENFATLNDGFRREGFQNPCVQVLATTFRAITEAKKFKRLRSRKKP